MKWKDVKTRIQREKLVTAVIEEIQKLKNLPHLKDIIENLELGSYEFAEGGWTYDLKMDSKGNLYCDKGDDPHKVTSTKELKELIIDMEIHPGDIIKIRNEIEA